MIKKIVNLWNPAAERFFGWKSSEIVGKALPTIPKRKSSEFDDIVRVTLGGKTCEPLDTKRRCKDGTLVDVRVWNAPLSSDYGGHNCAMAIFEDISEKRRVQRALNQARMASEKADTAKSTFIAGISHEFRTPLVAIMNYLDLLTTEDLTREEQLQYFSVMTANSQMLERLISDILDLSTIEAGRLTYRLAQVSLTDLFDEVAASLEGQAKNKGLQFEYDFSSIHSYRVETDAVRVKQILFNIMGNALKFTDEGSVRIVASGKVDSGNTLQMYVEVTDTGPGLSSEQSAKLFRPFAQAERSSPVPARGSGLGLYLARKIAQGLGGDVWIIRSQPDEGSTFGIRLAMTIVRSDSKDSGASREKKKAVG